MLDKAQEDSKRADVVAAIARDEWQQKQKQLADKITADAVGTGNEKIKATDDRLAAIFTSLRKRLDEAKPSDTIAAEFDEIEKELNGTEALLVAFNEEINSLGWSLKKTYRDKFRDFRQLKMDLEPLISSSKIKFKLV